MGRGCPRRRFEGRVHRCPRQRPQLLHTLRQGEKGESLLLIPHIADRGAGGCFRRGLRFVCQLVKTLIGSLLFIDW